MQTQKLFFFKAISVIILLGTLFISVSPVVFAASIPKAIANFTTSLASGITATDTAMTLVSGTDKAGNAISGYICFTIDEGSANEEFTCGTTTGTAVTSMLRGIDPVDGNLEVTALKKVHRRGASVKITNYPVLGVLARILNGDETLPNPISGVTPISGSDLTTKAYVDSVVNGGTISYDQTIIEGTAGATLAAGDAVYFNTGTGRWDLTDADTASLVENVLLGIAQGAGTVGNAVTGGVLLLGIDSNQSGLTPGLVYYLSNTAGDISSTPGTKTVAIGVAKSSTELILAPRFSQQLTQDLIGALAGSQGSPSSTNKFVTQDNVSTGLTDQSQTTQNSSSNVGEADTTGLRNDLAQSFIPAFTKIRGVNLYKSADTGTFTGTVTVTLQADTAGSPSGTPLATRVFTNAEYLALLTGEIDVIFATEYASMTVGSLYWIVIETSTNDTSNHPNIGINTAGGYASGSAKYKNATDGWVAISTIDLYFKTIQGTASQVVKTDTSGEIDLVFINEDDLGLPYLVGNGSPTQKLFFNQQLPFIFGTGSAVDAVTTDVEHWTKSGNDLNTYENNWGGFVDFDTASGADSYIVLSHPLNGSTIEWDDDNVVIFEWNAKYVSGTGRMHMGSFDSSVLVDVGETTNGTGMGFSINNGILYTVTKKADPNGVDLYTAVTGYTLTNWNTYRIEFDGGADTVRHYINGDLVRTTTGSGASSSIPVAGTVAIGFGHDVANPVVFRVTAPTMSFELNP